PHVQHIAGTLSLQAGDAVLTATPAGVGPLNSCAELTLELPVDSRFEARVL
ncbi:fumarylacetoacetate hydrolase family protein, partial [Pseudomonas aeruginosa]